LIPLQLWQFPLLKGPCYNNTRLLTIMSKIQLKCHSSAF